MCMGDKMKKLSELYDIDSDVEIGAVKINSKQVEKGDIFVCTKGVTADRHDFIEEAVRNGASAILMLLWKQVVKHILERD